MDNETLFETLAEATRPKQQPYITDVEWEVTTSGIKPTLAIVYDAEDDDNGTISLHIPHDKMREWAEDNGFLQWETNRPHPVTGEHVQDGGELGYLDWVREFMTERNVYDFCREKMSIQFPYRP